jgi:hypothetical protein
MHSYNHLCELYDFNAVHLIEWNNEIFDFDIQKNIENIAKKRK